MKRSLGLALALSLLAPMLFAQASTGNIYGSVSDASGAMLPGATVALTGATGGKMATAAEIVVRIPSTSTQHIQEAHIAVGHILCAIVERSLFPEAI